MTFSEFIVEVIESFRMGRRRFILATLTTVFDVFLLTLIVGAGLSLTRGIKASYVCAEKKMIWISPGITSIPYQGYGKDIPISLNDNDIRNIESTLGDRISSIIPITARMAAISIGKKDFKIGAYGLNPECMDALALIPFCGRIISESDIKTESRLCLIPKTMAERYFSISSPESAVSQYIEIDGIVFQIIGVFQGYREEVDTNFIILPATTAAAIWGMEGQYSRIGLDLAVDSKSLQTENDEDEFRDCIRKLIAHEHSFDYRDDKALVVSDSFSASRQVSSILGGVRMAILTFCLLVFISGIFGVSNIFFISVRERTYEIVLRRLMGASDFNIFSLIISESVLIMFISALVGTTLAETILSVIDSTISSGAAGHQGIWGSFNIDFPLLLAIILSAVISGIIAGIAPARRAVRINLNQIHS